jgi:hypothetical protein
MLCTVKRALKPSPALTPTSSSSSDAEWATPADKPFALLKSLTVMLGPSRRYQSPDPGMAKLPSLSNLTAHRLSLLIVLPSRHAVALFGDHKKLQQPFNFFI